MQLQCREARLDGAASAGCRKCRRHLHGLYDAGFPDKLCRSWTSHRIEPSPHAIQLYGRSMQSCVLHRASMNKAARGESNSHDPEPD